jgi:hypothetical protein
MIVEPTGTVIGNEATKASTNSNGKGTTCIFVLPDRLINGEQFRFVVMSSMSSPVLPCKPVFDRLARELVFLFMSLPRRSYYNADVVMSL